METFQLVTAGGRAVQWNGSNLADVQLLAGDAETINGGITLLVREAGREVRALQPGGWVTLFDDGTLITFSEHAFAHNCEVQLT